MPASGFLKHQPVCHLSSAIFQDAKICLISALTEGREVAFELCSIEEVLKHVRAN
jgi:hypothetical protein